ncbi:hypothetical protein [Pseudorhodobacter sp. MZDSW-24AT]|uniref:hypothetical protein n=1 Tax=Pseudorhodobacter sp. MZDSW-24AT TaxID=2052957 RepID=UPI0012FD870F|nr:hypothetical protein [Pseudorhodobacter sp. MZDSW-24AT]
MSTWTSKQGLWALAVLGWAMGLPLAAGAETLPKAVVLRAEGLTVQGPAGYCPDPATLKQTAGAATLLLGRCTDQAEAPPAVITVTFGRGGSASAMTVGGEEMAAFFASEAGRKSLSRRGRASDVSITSARSVGDLFLFRVSDRAEGVYWRGMTALAGRTISIKVSGPALEEAASRTLVEDTARALRRANR